MLVTNFMGYLIPSALGSRNVEPYHIETPSTITLDGARGVGESGTIAAYPATFNALDDALREAGAKGLNVAHATPELVLRPRIKNPTRQSQLTLESPRETSRFRYASSFRDRAFAARRKRESAAVGRQPRVMQMK